MEECDIKTDESKKIFFAVIENITDLGIAITNKDLNRPWGGFLVLDETMIERFVKIFFPSLNPSMFSNQIIKYSPKILMIAPKQRLSWQYHHRRAEIWSVIKGPVKVVMSDTDDPSIIQTLNNGDIITINTMQRHRLIGLDNWAIVAEIWQHTDTMNPSDENDIIRIQDDHGRADEFINIKI